MAEKKETDTNLSEKKNGKKPSAVKKALNIILDVVITLFVIFAVLMTILAFAAQSSQHSIPTISGKAILTVSTDSMHPTFNAGDIIIGQSLDTEEDKQSLQVGDIITFDAGDLDRDGKPDNNTHRIIEVNGEGDSIRYKTKGDNNQFADNDDISYRAVLCKYTGTRIPGLGKALNFLQSPKGFLIVIVIPLFLFFVFELINFIRKLLETRQVEKGHISEEEEEAIRKEAIAEYLRQQAAEREKAAAGGGETGEKTGTEDPGKNGDAP